MDSITEYAEYLLECSKQNPALLTKHVPGPSKGKSIDQKLLDIYFEESSKQSEDKHLDYASHLLGKLLKKERLNCLVLSLYPGNEGYSLMLRARSGVESETIKLPYEESEVLEYIDAAELPPFLLDLLEKAQVNVFYSGCVIVEVRDYRKSAPNCYDTHYVLLHPSAQSILCDTAALAAEFGSGNWTQEDLHQLEGELLLATSEPLCLDPSPVVVVVATELAHQQKLFNDPSLRKSIKRYTQTALNRKRKLAQGPAPRELRLIDFLHKKRDKSKNASATSKSPKNSIDMWKQRNLQLTAPENMEVEKYFKTPEIPASPMEDLILVEEHRLERDPNQERRMLACISIYHQCLADSFVGRLYLDHDFSTEGNSNQGCSCQFHLGTRQSVDRYLEQFRELFTEEGRRLVKITTQRPGQPPEVTLTQTPQVSATVLVPSSGTTSITISNTQALLKQASSLPAPITVPQGDASNSNIVTKRNFPIQLSLSLAPVTSVNSTQGVIAQQGTCQTAPALQTQASAQRLKQLSLHQRANSSPMPSPASTPTSSTSAQQLAAAFISQQQANLQKAPTPTLTPPPIPRTPTPTSIPGVAPTTSRRVSGSAAEGLTISQGASQPLQPAQNVSFIQDSSNNTVLTQSNNQGPQQLSNINIANIGSLGLTGLSGVSISNLGLPHMQVSLSMPGSMSGSIVPVPITVINSNSSILQNQTGILVCPAVTKVKL